jgi:thiamine kinase-like enzyme
MVVLPPIEEVLPLVPAWAGRPVEHSLLKGGLSHRIHRVTVDGHPYVLRVLNPAVSEAGLGIPPEQEIENTVRAAASGVGPRVLHVVPEVPAVVLEFLEGETMCVETVRDAANIPRIAHACLLLHRASRPFVNEFSIFRKLDELLAICRRHDLRVPDGFDDHLPAVRDVEQAMEASPLPRVPCHNDLLAENLIDTPGAVRIVDYQLSGMNDPTFELGDVAAESDYDPDRTGRLAAAYFGDELSPALAARVRLQLLMSNYTWTLWFSVYHGLLHDSAAEFDYWTEANDKWDQARRDIGSADFPRLLDAVQARPPPAAGPR